MLRSYKEMIRTRARKDFKFRRALLREALYSLLRLELRIACRLFGVVLFCGRRK